MSDSQRRATYMCRTFELHMLQKPEPVRVPYDLSSSKCNRCWSPILVLQRCDAHGWIVLVLMAHEVAHSL